MFCLPKYGLAPNYSFKWLALIALFTTSNSFAENKILVAATLEYPPYEYTENGVARGIAIDIIKEAALRTKTYDIEFDFLPWKRAVYTVKSGHNDVLFNAGKNEERQQWGKYVENVLILQEYVLFKKRSSSINVNSNFDNVKNHSIAVRLGYLYGSGNFRNAIDQNKFSGVTFSKSTQQSVDMLLSDRIDLFVGDYLPVMHYIKKNGLEDRIDIVKNSIDKTNDLIVLTWPTYIVFNKESVTDRYVDDFNNAMTEMKLDGFIDNVFKRYN